MNPLNSDKKLLVVVSFVIFVSLQLSPIAKCELVFYFDPDEYCLPPEDISDPGGWWHQEASGGSEAIPDVQDNIGSATVWAESTALSWSKANNQWGKSLTSACGYNCAGASLEIEGRWEDPLGSEPNYIQCDWSASFNTEVLSNSYTWGIDPWTDDAQIDSVAAGHTEIHVADAPVSLIYGIPDIPPDPGINSLAVCEGYLGFEHECESYNDFGQRFYFDGFSYYPFIEEEVDRGEAEHYTWYYGEGTYWTDTPWFCLGYVEADTIATCATFALSNNSACYAAADDEDYGAYGYADAFLEFDLSEHAGP